MRLSITRTLVWWWMGLGFEGLVSKGKSKGGFLPTFIEAGVGGSGSIGKIRNLISRADSENWTSSLR